MLPSPSQRAFWIFSGSDSGVDPAVLVVQFSLAPVHDVARLKHAWKQTIAQHDMLRASLNADKHGEPLLVVRESVADDIINVDLNQSPKVDINLAKVPTHQLHCCVAPDHVCHFIWHCHHALLDGWSAQLVIKDLIANYEGLQHDTETYQPAPRDYLAIHRQLHNLDNKQGDLFWQHLLNEYRSPAVFTAADAVTRNADVATIDAPLFDQAQSARLQALCKTSGITPATFMHFLWALTVGNLCDQSDTVIGVAVSGRPPIIPGIQDAVGCFATVAPCRLQQYADESVESHLKALQLQLFNASEYQHMGMLSVLEQADPACHSRLFDSLLVIENLPAIDSTASSNSIELRDYKSDIVSSYPLTLTLIPSDEWQLRWDYHADKLTENFLSSVADYFAFVANTLLNEWQAPLSRVNAASQALLPAHPNKELLTLRNSTGASRDEIFATLDGPVNQAELEMLALWEETLFIRPISMDSRFFDIGGNSLLAVQLIEKVSRNLNRKIPASVFLNNPTPRQCVDQVLGADEKPARIPCLFPLSEGVADSSATTHLYCLHAGGGHAMFYRDFAKNLPGNVSCYALQPKGIDGFEQPVSDLKQMASEYIAEIKQHQQVGPYHFICYCFGGALILEMAKQLQQQGDAIGHLIVADAPAPMPSNHPMAKFGWRAFLTYEFLAQNRVDLVWKAATTQLRNVVSRKRTASEINIRSLANVQQACEQGLKNYRASVTDLPLTILNAGHKKAGMSHIFVSRWKKLAPNNMEYSLEGKHGFMFDKPDVIETAAVVATVLATAPAVSGSAVHQSLEVTQGMT